MEDLDEHFPDAIQDFLGLEHAIELLKTNIGKEKHYSEHFRKVKSNILLNEETIAEVINSKFFSHFYSDKVEDIKTKWMADY